MKTTIAAFAALALIAVVTPRAEASLGGTEALNFVTPINPFFIIYETQAPGVTWTFQTTNLSAGADTVINVQNADDPQGGFVAGNDDGGGNGLASLVVVPPAATTRTLAVIVRSFDTDSQGTCTFTATPSNGTASVFNNTFFGGIGINLGDLAAGTHVTTAERRGGSNDTVLLVVSGDASHVAGFDDDDGVDLMSWIHLDEACTSCLAIVANFGDVEAVNTTIVWDQNADATDFDGDGLGQNLEAAIGTNPNIADTDQDGINDGYELLGADLATPVKFPLMGASPTQQDLFIEIDWNQCTDPTCNGNIDLGQVGWTPIAGNIVPYAQGIAAQVESDLAPLKVHMDIGITNTDSTTWYTWGNWGGASRGDYTNGTEDASGGNTEGCEGASPERQNLFHFAVSFAPYGGHVWTLPGSCMVVTNDEGSNTDTVTPARVISHETGHTLGLRHGGRPFKISLNYKPQYESYMNYLYQWTAPSFSHGTSPVPVLKPTSLDETLGLGASDQTVLTSLQNNWCPGGTCVNLTTGSVDWNRDGIISPSTTKVQGAVSVVDYSQYARSEFASKLNDPSVTWVSVGGTVGDQLWMFGRSSPGNVLQYARISKTALNNGCGSFTALDSDNPATDCAGLAGATTDVPGNKLLTFGPGAAEVSGKILVVSQRTTGTLTSNLLTINSSSGAVTYGADVVLPGAIAAKGDVTALSTGSGVVTVWAPGGNPVRLKQWKFQNSAWTGPTDQQWADATFVSPKFGIGATIGFQDGSSTSKVYAAISTTVGTSGNIELARQETTGRWTKLAAWTMVSQPVASGRPGIAYQRRSGQANSVGRFYMAFNQASCTGVYGAAPCQSMMLMTEGNKSSGSTQRLQWLRPALFSDPGMPGGIGLVDDLNRDANLRGVSTHPSGTQTNGWFSPVVDGIFNASVSDLNDYPYLTGALRAALCLDGGSFPNGVLPPSLP